METTPPNPPAAMPSLPTVTQSGRGFFKQLWLVLTSPRRFFASLGPDTTLGSGIGYFWLIAIVSVIIDMGISLTYPSNRTFLFGPDSGANLLFVSIGVSLLILAFFAGGFLRVAVTHGFLRLFRGEGTYAQSYAVVIYGDTPALLFSVIPLAQYFVNFWSFYLRLVGLTIVHRVPVWKAAMADIFGSALLGGGIVALVFGTMFGLIPAIHRYERTHLSSADQQQYARISAALAYNIPTTVTMTPERTPSATEIRASFMSIDPKAVPKEYTIDGPLNDGWASFVDHPDTAAHDSFFNQGMSSIVEQMFPSGTAADGSTIFTASSSGIACSGRLSQVPDVSRDEVGRGSRKVLRGIDVTHTDLTIAICRVGQQYDAVLFQHSARVVDRHFTTQAEYDAFKANPGPTPDDTEKLKTSGVVGALENILPGFQTTTSTPLAPSADDQKTTAKILDQLGYRVPAHFSAAFNIVHREDDNRDVPQATVTDSETTSVFSFVPDFDDGADIVAHPQSYYNEQNLASYQDEAAGSGLGKSTLVGHSFRSFSDGGKSFPIIWFRTATASATLMGPSSILGTSDYAMNGKIYRIHIVGNAKGATLDEQIANFTPTLQAFLTGFHVSP